MTQCTLCQHIKRLLFFFFFYNRQWVNRVTRCVRRVKRQLSVSICDTTPSNAVTLVVIWSLINTCFLHTTVAAYMKSNKNYSLMLFGHKSFFAVCGLRAADTAVLIPHAHVQSFPLLTLMQKKYIDGTVNYVILYLKRQELHLSAL